jgi:hypothetical protein
MRKRRDGNTRSNFLRTLWKNAWTYRRLEGFRGGFAIRRQALGTALGLGEKRGDLPGMWCVPETLLYEIGKNPNPTRSPIEIESVQTTLLSLPD